MATTVRQLVDFLSEYPDDTEVKVREKNSTTDNHINSLISFQSESTDGLEKVDGIIISPNYYGA